MRADGATHIAVLRLPCLDAQFVHDVWVHLAFALHPFKRIINLSLLYNSFFLHDSPLVHDVCLLVFKRL